MLRKFAAALIATTLIAGPAFAQSNGTSGTMPAAPSAQTVPASPTASTPATKPAVKTPVETAKMAKTAKTAKTAKHSAKHARKHAARSMKKGAAIHQARHAKPAKTHQAVATTAAKRS